MDGPLCLSRNKGLAQCNAIKHFLLVFVDITIFGSYDKVRNVRDQLFLVNLSADICLFPGSVRHLRCGLAYWNGLLAASEVGLFQRIFMHAQTGKITHQSNIRHTIILYTFSVGLVLWVGWIYLNSKMQHFCKSAMITKVVLVYATKKCVKVPKHV